MDEKTAVFITGFFCFTLIKKYIKADEKCEIILTEVNCTYRNLTSIPLDWDRNITTLDLRYATIQYLDDTSFEKYTNLRLLKMDHATVINATGRNIFKPLVNLLQLFMVQLSIDKSQFYYYTWPINLEELNLIIENFDEKDFQGYNQFYKLKRISMPFNTFHFFPKLNHYSPLEYINFNGMEFIMKVEDIVPYCKLRHFSANFAFVSDSENQSETIKCDCWHTLNWLQANQIQTNLQCEKGIKCKKTAISKEYLSINEQCLNKTIQPEEPTTTIQSEINRNTNLYVWILISFIVMILVFIAYNVDIISSRSTPRMETEPENVVDKEQKKEQNDNVSKDAKEKQTSGESRSHEKESKKKSEDQIEVMKNEKDKNKTDEKNKNEKGKKQNKKMTRKIEENQDKTKGN